MTATPRTCGPCSLCCKVLAIPEVPTAKDTWCVHAKKGYGCTIYAHRPEPCHSFRCLWLDGDLPEWARPDRIHGVVFRVGEVLQVAEDPGYPHHASDQLEPLLTGIYRAGGVVTILCGTSWRARGTPETLKTIERIEAI